jgi:hypothetical protein
MAADDDPNRDNQPEQASDPGGYPHLLIPSSRQRRPYLTQEAADGYRRGHEARHWLHH